MRLNRSRKINFIIPLLLHPARSEKNLQDLKDSCGHPEPYRHPDFRRDDGKGRDDDKGRDGR